jgi:hypothetical protein
MALRPGLIRSTRFRLLALGAGVLLAHGVALEAFSRWQVPSVLQPMVAPMYTRVLQPQAPPAAPAAAAVAPTAPATPGVLAARKPRPAASKPAAAKAEPPPTPSEPVAATEPASAEPAAAALPAEAAASAPVPAAPEAGAPATSATAAAPSGLDSWPTDTRLRYQVTGRFRGDLYGNAQVLWQREGARYQVRVEVNVSLAPRQTMTSQGQVTPEGLAPEVYEEQRGGRARGLRIGEREVMLANGDVLRRPPGLQDTASQFVELSHRFASGRERLEVGRAVSFWMARPGAVDRWTYDVVTRETLRTALGEVEAFHLKPRPLANPRGNITAEMWFAPALQHLPVRIRVNMGDEAFVDLLVESIEQR